MDGQPWDMYKPLTKSCEIKFLTFKDRDPGEVNKVLLSPYSPSPSLTPSFFLLLFIKIYFLWSMKCANIQIAKGKCTVLDSVLLVRLGIFIVQIITSSIQSSVFWFEETIWHALYIYSFVQLTLTDHLLY